MIAQRFYRWVADYAQNVCRPVGTIENSPGNDTFGRPYGTQNPLVAYLPSSELLGYYQASLRDQQTGRLV